MGIGKPNEEGLGSGETPGAFAAASGIGRQPRGYAQRQDDDRLKIYDMMVAEKMLMQGFHYPFPALGHIEKDGNGYRVVPVIWSPAL